MSKKLSYDKLITYSTLEDRFKYLQLQGSIGSATFGGHRHLNQVLYRSKEWKLFRRDIIIRDKGFDLAHPDYKIFGKICVHHLNPITIDDILNRNPIIFDPDNAVCASFNTHEAIHYGNIDLLPAEPAVREKNDTCLWR